MSARVVVSPASLAFALAVALTCTPACARGPAMRARIRDLEATLEDAQRKGAMRCAPRELALGKSQLEFAEIDLSQGQLSSAQAHLSKAEPNVQAAFALSAPDRCTEHLADTPSAQ